MIGISSNRRCVMKVLIIEHAPLRAEGLIQEASKYGVSYRLWAPYKDAALEDDITAFDGLIIGGGPMGVYELNNFPFFASELKYVENALRIKIPVLGICLGSQMLAYINGGIVSKTFWRRGYYYVSCTVCGNKDVLFHDIKTSFPTFQYHKDEIITLPSNACITLTSDNCAIEGFRLLDMPVWGIQSHPEMNLKKAKLILGSDSTITPNALVPMLKNGENVRERTNTIIFRNFFRFCSNKVSFL